MPRLIRKPLPDPFTADAAALHLYRAWTGQGKFPLRRIELHNPHMVNALREHWRREHSGARPEGLILARGTLAGIGRWTLVRTPGQESGALQIDPFISDEQAGRR